MRCNVALWDRALRFVVGILLTAFSIAGGPAWGYIGIVLLMTSAWGFCPVYAFFRVRTQKLPPRRKEPADETE